MFRRSAARLRYHQEVFMPRQDAFLIQVMRGLKVEKRWEPGMGNGIFAREAVGGGSLVMYDLPFMSMELDEMPRVLREALKEFGVEEKIQQVLDATARDTAYHSKQPVDKVIAYMVHKNIDLDITWMTLIASWGVAWCNKQSPNTVAPLSYYSYVDDYYREDPVGQNIMDIAYENIVDITGITSAVWDKEDFWVSLFKYKSNVFKGSLYPVAPTLINHSCWPNATFAEDGSLVALRDINPNEQVTVALYGSNCKDVEKNGLGGSKFKCMTPGCQWSLRVPLPLPKEEKEEPLYITPWHRIDMPLPMPGVDVPELEQFTTPANKKFKQMYTNEVTRGGRDLNSTPELPGSRPKRYRINANPINGKYITETKAKGSQLVPELLEPGSSRNSHRSL
eukprot:TRINITY_DN34648_c0_g1_i1.p1 TRINITY_DN34648_c0_g1~~TRINITY_DN34648_c0_g1_i1.p1  ORF type:complete len:393 (+),score=89.86 TRINITY_DN34648_c0_g1_i1:40-1218(+)